MVVKGIVAAAMLAALMSTVSGALNSIATVFCYDIYRPLFPDTSDRKLIVVGRFVTVTAMVFAIIWAPQIGKFGSILEGNTAMICYIAPSLTTIFLGGVLWHRASAQGAFITLCSGTILGFIVFLLDWNREVTGWNYSFMMASFWLFLICSAVFVVSSLLYPQEHTLESENLVWKNPLEALSSPGWKGVLNYKFLTGLLLAIMVVLYIVFD